MLNVYSLTCLHRHQRIHSHLLLSLNRWHHLCTDAPASYPLVITMVTGEAGLAFCSAAIQNMSTHRCSNESTRRVPTRERGHIAARVNETFQCCSQRNRRCDSNGSDPCTVRVMLPWKALEDRSRFSGRPRRFGLLPTNFSVICAPAWRGWLPANLPPKGLPQQSSRPTPAERDPRYIEGLLGQSTATYVQNIEGRRTSGVLGPH